MLLLAAEEALRFFPGEAPFFRESAESFWISLSAIVADGSWLL